MAHVTVNTTTPAEWKSVQEWVLARGGRWAGGEAEILQPKEGVRYGGKTVIHIDSDMQMVYADIEYARSVGWTVITYRMFAVNRGILSPSKTISSHMGMILDREEVKIVEKFSEALIVVVDDLGRIREEMKQLKEDEEEAKKKIKSFQLAIGDYEGTEFALKVSEVASAELSPPKVMDKLGTDRFMQVIRVIKKEAERFMSKEEMDTCSEEPTISIKYATRRLKK